MKKIKIIILGIMIFQMMPTFSLASSTFGGSCFFHNLYIQGSINIGFDNHLGVCLDKDDPVYFDAIDCAAQNAIENCFNKLKNVHECIKDGKFIKITQTEVETKQNGKFCRYKVIYEVGKHEKVEKSVYTPGLKSRPTPGKDIDIFDIKRPEESVFYTMSKFRRLQHDMGTNCFFESYGSEAFGPGLNDVKKTLSLMYKWEKQSDKCKGKFVKMMRQHRFFSNSLVDIKKEYPYDGEKYKLRMKQQLATPQELSSKDILKSWNKIHTYDAVKEYNLEAINLWNLMLNEANGDSKLATTMYFNRPGFFSRKKTFSKNLLKRIGNFNNRVSTFVASGNYRIISEKKGVLHRLFVQVLVEILAWKHERYVQAASWARDHRKYWHIVSVYGDLANTGSTVWSGSREAKKKVIEYFDPFASISKIFLNYQIKGCSSFGINPKFTATVLGYYKPTWLKPLFKKMLQECQDENTFSHIDKNKATNKILKTMAKSFSNYYKIGERK